LAERDKVMEALEDDVLLAKMRAVAGVLQPVPGNCFLRVGNARVRDVVQPLINPRLKVIQERPHRHVVVIHDWLRWVAEGENGVEALSDCADLRRNCITLHPEVQVPVNIPVVIEIVPHERFSGELRVEQRVKKGDHLVTVHRSVQVGRNRGHVNPLAKVVVAAVLQTLEKYGHTLLRRRLPVLIDQPPEVVGQGVLLGKCHVDHRQRGTLALIDAGEKKWDDGVFHISPVKVRRDGGAEPGQCRRKIWRCGAGCRGLSGESGAGNKAGRAGSGASQNRPSFHLDTPLDMRAISSRQTYRETQT
jgi:hypothetical protein